MERQKDVTNKIKVCRGWLCKEVIMIGSNYLPVYSHGQILIMAKVRDGNTRCY